MLDSNSHYESAVSFRAFQLSSKDHRAPFDIQNFEPYAFIFYFGDSLSHRLVTLMSSHSSLTSSEEHRLFLPLHQGKAGIFGRPTSRSASRHSPDSFSVQHPVRMALTPALQTSQ